MNREQGILRGVRTLSCSVVMLAVLASSNASAAPAVPAAAPKVLPFIENDYAAALAQAKARGVPVFVDVWAPW